MTPAFGELTGAEACWRFETITNDIGYSHEVGLRKPDPAIFRARC